MKALHFNFDIRELVTNFRIIKDEIEENETDIASNTASINLKLKTADVITFDTGAPGSDVTSIFYVDTSALRLYVKVSGTWRYTALT